MEEQRTHQLIEFMVREGLVPTPYEELKRKDAVAQLKQIVLAWIKKIAWQRRLPRNQIASTGATILTYGSYALGVHGSESDIDALCVGPIFATIAEDFFIVLHNMLQSRPEVSEIHCVKSAKIPLMRFKFNGISIDLPYAQLSAVSVPDNENILSPFTLKNIDETSQRSLSGVRANRRIRQLVPNLEKFQSMLRCVKLWAKRRGMYSTLLGFFGGIHLAILAAYVCQIHPDASISDLILNFFETFSKWHWPEPVILQDGSPVWRNNPNVPIKSLMPIMMPCFPYDCCRSSITLSTHKKIMTELCRGQNITRDLGSPDFEWSILFEPYPYTKRYTHFVRILLSAPDADELRDWLGWVKSRFRSLLLKLEEMKMPCDPNPTEFVDSKVAELNTVFYWGLLPNQSSRVDIGSVEEEFMKIIETDHQGSSCHLELSIVESSQLPKSAHVDSQGGKKGSKACWRIMDYNQQRKPLYSLYVQHYIVGYVATDKDGFPL